jgi:hypothetical protein
MMREIREPADATAEIFRRHVETAFFPVVLANKKLPGCRKKPTIFFCDICAYHCSEDTFIEFAHHGVPVLSYPPHTSNLFQLLDPLPFGGLKSAKKSMPRNDREPGSIDHIIRIFKADETETTSTMVGSCWEKAGFEYAKMGETTIYWSMMGKSENRLTFWKSGG